MIRRFERGAQWEEIRLLPGYLELYEYRNNFTSTTWTEDTISGITEALQNFNDGGWKEVTAAVDPNDLQASCQHVWDRATDTCQLCKQSWNSILWSSSGRCCAPPDSNIPAQYSGGMWHQIDCNSLKPKPAEVSPQIDYRPKAETHHRCQCGAWATSNPTCHSFWCPEHKK